ncbi:regulator of chromosome condensation 1/beta-lactamase-inhibitor protein II [Tuber borchii]|uniref:Regulator of chromosome condensation 1/beta-lactamase-inhibitor protein II n=1 Tax=Tuber borchii TaxID=42251 RepID=A0A2T6ZZ55_TUBBO|nr:regulator of chromosome condensation 1/beta-lactamase-inhibitor protein II [Tuber borchii]
MSSEPLSLGDFPSEILDRILDHVGYKGAINLSRTSKGFYNTLYNEETGYWKREAQRVFKTPHVDSLINKVPWRYLFQGMAKAHVYTWGQGADGRLGHDRSPPDNYRRFPYSVAVPFEILGLRDKFVVDIVGGGWSTSFLTSDGHVYIAGRLSDRLGGGEETPTAEIKFPEPISQLSSGRDHLIALSNKGRVYTCIDKSQGAQRVKFSAMASDSDSGCLTPDKIGGVAEDIGWVKKVVGGWDRCAALISGIGIVVWRPTDSREHIPGPYTPSVRVIRGTNYLDKPPKGISAEVLAGVQKHKSIGQVVDFTLGEGYLVFLTITGKVFAVSGFDQEFDQAAPVELVHFSSPEGQPPVNRISGNFRRFAVLNKEGTVRVGDVDIVRNSAEGKTEGVKPIRRPDFASYKVVDIAFGDHHGLALTDEGEILSWGTESRMCGCLGLGDQLPGMGMVDGRFANLEVSKPKVVSFRPPGEDAGSSEGEDKTKYYAFNIAASGWHSGALVLGLDGGHAQEDDGVPESSMLEVNDDPTQIPDPPDLGFDPEALGSGGRERGHRGIRGVTSTRFSARGGMSRGGFVRSGLQGLSLFSPGKPT